MQYIHISTIIAPLLMGILSFLVKNRYAKIVNICYLFLFIGFFFLILSSIFKLNLIHDTEYSIVVGGWPKAMGIELKYNLSYAFIILFSSLIMIVFFATIINHVTIAYDFRGFICIMLSGVNGIVLTNDIFNSYVFFEIICVTSYIIYSYCKSIICLKSVYNYMILSSFVGIIILLVIGFLYQITGNLNITFVNEALKKVYDNKSISASFVLFILVMSFKLGAYPLHSLVLEIYRNISLKYLIPVACLSSIVYPYFVVKFVTKLFGSDVLLNNEYLNIVLKILGSTGFIFFNSTALTVRSVLGFIIFLSFAQASLFIFCIPYLLDNYVINGISFLITSNSLLKACLFSILYKIQKQMNVRDIKKSDIGNITSNSYKYLFIAILFLLSGMPFSLVFMSKLYLLVGIYNVSDNMFWLFTIIIGFVIDIFACFFFIREIFLKKDKLFNIKTDFLLTSVIFLSIIILIISTFFIGNFL